MNLGRPPSDGQFLQYFKELAAPQFRDLDEKRANLTLTESALSAFFADVWDRRAGYVASWEATFVHRWLQSQSSYRHAIASVYRRRPATAVLPEKEYYVSHRVERSLNQLAMQGKSPELEEHENDLTTRKLEHEVRRDMGFSYQFPAVLPVIALERDLVAAFWRYLNDGHVKTIELRSGIEDALNAALRAKKIEAEHIRPVYMRLRYRSDSLMRERDKESALEHYENFLRRRLAKLYPGRRQDETLPERVLLWELRAVFQNHFKSDKTTALVWLMGLPGIKYTLDPSTVERNLRNWRKLTTTPLG